MSYICECGREFENVKSCNSHKRFCKEHKHNQGYVSKSKYKLNDNLYKCECGREFTSSQALNGHFNGCSIHRISIGKSPQSPNSGKSWSEFIKLKNKNIPEQRKEEIKQNQKLGRIKLKERYKNGEIVPAFKGKHHTEETKEKMRIIVAKRNREKYGHVVTNYSEKACKFIDELNIKNGWDLQHALNGGEKIIKGYYLDGYDEKRNIAFEYDEPRHYTDKESNILRVYDQMRQFIIIKNLKCKLYRYNEYTKTLYEVIDPKYPEYDNIEKLIFSGKLNFSSRQNLKDSIKKFGYSYKLYDIFVDEHPELNLKKFQAISSKKSNFVSQEYIEKKRKTKEEKTQKQQKRIQERLESHNRFVKKQQERMALLLEIKEIIKDINLSDFGKISKLKNRLKIKLNKNVTTKQIYCCLKSFKEFELINLLFTKNENYSKQCWVTNKDKEIKRIPENELSKYLENGWVQGRKWLGV